MLGKRARFQPNQDWVQTRVNTVPELLDSQILVQLDPDSSAQSITKDFICRICHGVVWNAKQCGHSGCNILLCSNCVEQWDDSEDKKCLNCYKAFNFSIVDNRILKN